MNKGHEYEYKKILPGSLKADRTYQREINQKKVKRIVDDFNPDLFNAPKVSKRSNGDYYVFDGDHSVVAHRRVYGETEPIECKVFYGLTWEEEKDLFVKQNGISSDPTTYEKLRAEYNGGNPDVVDMVNAASEAGVVINLANKSQGYSKCVAAAAAFSAYKMLARKEYISMFSVLNKAWEGEPISFSAGFVFGMAQFFKKYSGQFQPSELIKKLSKESVQYFIREAKNTVGRLGNRYEKEFLKVYNKGRSANIIEAK